MSEQVKALTLTQDMLVQLLAQRRQEAISRADAEFSRGMSAFCREFNAPDGTRFQYEPAVGPIPARLTYDAPDLPAPPAEA